MDPRAEKAIVTAIAYSLIIYVALIIASSILLNTDIVVTNLPNWLRIFTCLAVIVLPILLLYLSISIIKRNYDDGT